MSNPFDELDDALSRINETEPAKEPVAPTNTNTDPEDFLSAGVAPAVTVASTTTVKNEFPIQPQLNLAFVGLGQGGGHIAAGFWPYGYRQVCAFNSTEADFAALPTDMEKESIELGGCQKQARIAEAAMQDVTNQGKLRHLIEKSWGTDVDYAFICVGFGGGTGSGCTETAIKVVREYLASIDVDPNRVGVIASIPEPGQGIQVSRNALTAIHKAKAANVSPMILLDNAKIQKLHKPGIMKMYSIGVQQICFQIHAMNTMSAMPSNLATFDESELLHLFAGGVMSLGQFSLEQYHTPSNISRELMAKLSDSVLCDLDLSAGDRAVLLMRGPESVLDELTSDHLKACTDSLGRLIGRSETSMIHRGVYIGGPEGFLSVFVGLSGFPLPQQALTALQVAAKIDPKKGAPIGEFLGL